MSKIKELRLKHNLTQEELGKILNVQKAAVSKYEKGIASPSNEVLKKLSAFFNVSIDYLLDNEPPKNNIESEETKLLNGFQSLNTDGQNILLNVLNSLRMSHSKINAVSV